MNKYLNYLYIKNYILILIIKFLLNIGNGDWGLGIGPKPQSPIPNPQSPNDIIKF